MEHFVYLVTNKVNNKKYVGITINTGRRWWQHCNAVDNRRSEYPLTRAINKYHEDNFTFEVLDQVSCREEANRLEVYYIANFNTLTKNKQGYNQTLGGDGTNYFEWTKDVEAAMGTMSDEKLANKLSISQSAVSNRRKSLGITSFNSSKIKVTWTKEMDSLLGKDKDSVVAKKLKIGKSSVARRRKYLRIPATQVNKIVWTEEMLSILGTDTDANIAEKLELSRYNVSRARQKEGIPPINPNLVVWSEEMLKGLGCMADTDFALLYKVGLATVRLKRKVLAIPTYRKEKSK